MPRTFAQWEEPTAIDRFGDAFESAGDSFGKSYADRLLRKQENTSIRDMLGEDISGIHDPELRRDFISSSLQGRNQQRLQQEKSKNDYKKAIEDKFLEEQNYSSIKNTFGKKFADLWKASPTGGRTELIKHGIDAKLRGDDLEETLRDLQIPEYETQKSQLAPVPQSKNGKPSKKMEWPDFTKRPPGYTPKDWISERKTWRSENSEVFLKNKNSLKNSKTDQMAFKNLKRLNAKLPEGIDRWIINPVTGEPWQLAQLSEKVPTEVQEWVKEIARFQNRAKDAFGSRVTNFDLQSYMKQYPGLLNTKEGRERIIQLLEINNDLDKLYEEALDSVYKHYGLNGIPQEEADNLAQSMIQEDTDKLTEKYLNVDEKNQKEMEGMTGNLIRVFGPDGKEYEMDISFLDQLPEGYRIK